MDDTEVDRALALWRQGDCVVGEHWFVQRIVANANGVDVQELPVDGFVVLTQTCDVIRASKDRPVLEVSPLVPVDAQDLRMIAKHYRPRYAYVPALESKGLVADLDRVMTIEKGVVAGWTRIPGCTSDHEARTFAMVIGRKRTRFAFPDDFTRLARRLLDRFVDKHDRDSPEGRGLRALREIRVQAAPSWDAPQVDLLFWFIRNDQDDTFDSPDGSSLLDKWLALVPAADRFMTVEGQIMSLERLTADEYVHSDLLDLDHLSGPVTT